MTGSQATGAAGRNGTPPFRRARILVASAQSGFQRISTAIGHYRDFDVLQASTLTEAEVNLRTQAHPFDLILVGMHFAGSAMFDLLKLVKSDRRHRAVPLICVRGVSQSEFQAPIGLEAVEIACLLSGAAAFIDLLNYVSEAEANAALRSEVERILGL